MNTKYIKSILPPLFSLAFIVAGSSPFLTFISLKLQASGYTEAIIGYVQAFYWVGYLIGSIVIEKFIVKIGYIKSFIMIASIMALSFIVQGLYLNIFYWCFLRIISGFCLAAAYVIIESWLMTDSSPNNKGRILSIYMIALYASQASSQMLIKNINLSSFIPYLLFGVICLISILPVSITHECPEISKTKSHKLKIKSIYKQVSLGIIGACSAGFILSAIYGLTPVFAKTNNISVSYIMSITIAGGFLLQWPLGYISDIIDRRLVLIFSTLSLFVISILMIIFSHSSAAVLILSFLLGGCAFTVYPVSITQVCDRIDQKYISYVIGLLSLIYGIGAILGPVISAYIMEIHVSGLYLYIGLLGLLVGSLGIYYKLKKPKTLSPEEKNEYIPIPPTTTPIIPELDPRMAKNIENNWIVKNKKKSK